MTIYERVADLCKVKGISISTLERNLGFSHGSIGKWKTSDPTKGRIEKTAEYFGVSTDYLLFGKDTEKESESGKKYYFDDDTAEKAQELFEKPGMRILFDAARDSRPEDLQMAADLPQPAAIGKVERDLRQPFGKV